MTGSIDANTLGTDKDDSLTLEPRLYKLNAYSKGGFFKSHRDTPKGDHHVGTLLIGLPVAYEGGALRVAHAGREVVFDWGPKCSEGVVTRETKSKISIPWAFLFSDVEHEVLPVLSGTRVTIAYDIFVFKPSSMSSPKPNIEAYTCHIYNEIKLALQNPDFLPKGATLAIALSHAYPMPINEMSPHELASGLKGSDALLYRDLTSLGLGVSLEAVYEAHPDECRGYRRTSHRIPEDGYEPMIKHGDGSCVYYTSEHFSYGDIRLENEHGLVSEETGYYSFENFAEASDKLKPKFKFDPEMMWIKKPTNTFTQAGSYIAYSNEHSIAHYYAAVIFRVSIPPYDVRARK